MKLNSLLLTEGVVTPRTDAWDGASPLVNGVGIKRALRMGTTGVAIDLNGVVMFTCARHVVGELNSTGPLAVWMKVGAASGWQSSQAVNLSESVAGQHDALARMDLGFLSI